MELSRVLSWKWLGAESAWRGRAVCAWPGSPSSQDIPSWLLVEKGEWSQGAWALPLSEVFAFVYLGDNGKKKEGRNGCNV